MSDRAAREEAARAFAARLLIGEGLPVGDLIHDDLFPFEGQILTKPLDPPLLPEPPRRGEPGGEPCPACQAHDERVIWRDDRWWVAAGDEPHGLPMVLNLLPREHHDLEDLPVELVGELGPMIQRVARAINRIDGIGRVHVNRWGDGTEHFHVWFLARPAGMWQMRGAMLAVWDDLLPKLADDVWQRNRRTVAAALAAGGGEVLV